MAFQGFGKNSGPASLPPPATVLFGNISPPPSSPANPNHHLHTQESQRWDSWPKSSHGHQRPISPATPFFDSDINSGTRIPAEATNVQASKRTRSPPLSYDDEIFIAHPHTDQFESGRWDSWPKSSQVHPRSISAATPFFDSDNNSGTRIPAEATNVQASKRTRSPPLCYEDEIFFAHPHTDQFGTGRSVASLTRSDALLKSPFNGANSQSYQRPLSLATPFVDVHNAGTKFPSKAVNMQVPKRTRSPPVPSVDEVFFSQSLTDQIETERSAVTPPRWSNQPKSPFYNTNPQAHQQLVSLSSPSVDARNAGTAFLAKAVNTQGPKRIRSPPIPSAHENTSLSHTNQIENERERQAKAKRLARFNVELSQSLGNSDLTKQTVLSNKHDRSVMERKIVTEYSVGEVRDLASISSFADSELLEGPVNKESESSKVIVGLCPDMCPESEREERQRKGDLDKYERLDGERNQTSKSLAVKKYNRTAERESNLIRPMPVLRKTIDYLLDLLNRPYDDKFLGLYNFLWDRMRAIRMDLRMQHIFNKDAILMQEQMIRLHIIAMHELCDYTRGEGFSEGFDAHLNIEQMNKTSVELFQMYDDHRKKGESVPTEKEFRGYYALLKLDKHPGHRVEPAELSLDLSKMALEIRHAPEILFARDVARACRKGNFIAFFRLARRATYLQTCLMHAHFAKLRTQALASLHSSLQFNQGIPVAEVVKWLAMEDENIEDLLEYHGFSIKKYEDYYMVKEGPFLLNSEKDYPTKCSQLVHSKKSNRIIEDVSSAQLPSWPSEERRVIISNNTSKKADNLIEPDILVNLVDEEMADYEDSTALRDGGQVSMPVERSMAAIYDDADGYDEEEANCFFIEADDNLSYYTSPDEDGKVAKSAPYAHMDRLQDNKLSFVETRRVLGEEAPSVSNSHCIRENPVKQKKLVENGALMIWEIEAAEAARSKLKLILRIWKRRSSRLREIRELHQLMADAALNSLSLGPSIRKNKPEPSPSGELNIDQVMSERRGKLGKSWSRLNVSELVAPILEERNPDCKCLCWKLIICSQLNAGRQSNQIVGSWLVSKLMGIGGDGLAVSSPGLSIWKKWISRDTDSPQICCLSIIRDAEFDDDKLVLKDDLVSGSSGIVFLVTETVDWEIQKFRLHSLLMLVPPGSKLPLLILTAGLFNEENPDPSITIINRLGLCNLDTTRISSFSVHLLSEIWPQDSIGFLSDNCLREGLQWLAKQSPLQPILCKVKARKLVLSFLDSSMEVLDKMERSKMDPNLPIKAFNEALDRSIEEVRIAAEMNCFCWPSHEIGLVEESSREGRAINSFLPKVNWSSHSEIDRISNAMKGCRLPFFTKELPWLKQGSYMGKDIENQKLEFENCLNWYLTQASKMMSGTLAEKEASLLVQKGGTLGCDGSNYLITPNWVVIFRRIFNWRLMNLTGRSSLAAYVLKHRHVPTNLVENRPIEYAPTGLSLDEMVEAACQVPFPPYLAIAEVGEVFGSSSDAMEEDDDHRSAGLAENTGSVENNEHFANVGLIENYDNFMKNNENFTSFELMENNNFMKRNENFLLADSGDKLRRLLEQCDVLQNRIDRKLAIYF